MQKTKAPRKPRLGDMRKMPDGSKAEFVRGVDAHGHSSEHFRTVDTLGLLLKRGKIDVPAYDAGRRFAENFQDAAFTGISANNFASGVNGGCSASSDTMPEKVVIARQRVHHALKAVGGMESLGGKILWDVVGLGFSVKQTSKNVSKNYQEAMGMLTALLSVLAVHYGYKISLKKLVDTK